MIKKCHYDVILWGGFGSTKCDPNLTSHLRRFFAGNNHVKFQKSTSYTALVMTDESKFLGSGHFWVTFDL